SASSGTQVIFDAIGAHTVTGTSNTNYTMTLSGDCASDGSVTLSVGDIKSCTVTQNDKAPVAPPPSGGGGGVTWIPVGGGSPSGQVLGASTQCGIYVSKFLRRHYKNNVDETKKLQKFLGENLKIDLPVTGFFGALTESAVKQYQLKHKDKILVPW